LSSSGRQILGEYNMRAPDCQIEAPPQPGQIFSVADLGGWSQAYAELVDGVWKKEIEPNLSLEASPQGPATREP
jgi:hypothetical protein